LSIGCAGWRAAWFGFNPPTYSTDYTHINYFAPTHFDRWAYSLSALYLDSLCAGFYNTTPMMLHLTSQ
jgi:hypothetical protein